MSKFKVGDEVWVERERSSYYRGVVGEVLPVIHTSLCRYAITDYSGCTDIVEESKIEIMKKKANLTLETAKEFYKQGGAARKFALDNYSRDELTQPDWPESWEDLRLLQGVNMRSGVIYQGCEFATTNKSNKVTYPTKEDADSAVALAQLQQLAKKMNNGWEPTKKDSGYTIIALLGYELNVVANIGQKVTIPFKSKRMAIFSRKHHRELWEKYYKL